MRCGPGGRAVLEGPEPYLDERTTALALFSPILAAEAVARPLFGNVAVIFAVPRASVRACARRKVTVAPLTGLPALSMTLKVNRTRLAGFALAGVADSSRPVALAL